VRSDEFLDKRKPDTATLVSSAPLTFDAVEAFEQARQLLSRYADTGVAD
jgi:hypothetical protein